MYNNAYWAFNLLGNFDIKLIIEFITFTFNAKWLEQLIDTSLSIYSYVKFYTFLLQTWFEP